MTKTQISRVLSKREEQPAKDKGSLTVAESAETGKVILSHL